ncbi:hypothetical protein BT96DRAFT_844332 [Gymnopus androsaceus JB14]|uniref:G domain-containing protein n=1 Tax=Gymnopus androsaceus JB14 TaxID=1447944 RepID=A0A6A4GCV7_9AGAR|nr:hypothetical protein BT96DRAFT_844332 [Gymnopus androsaceus JB14]
MATNPPELPSKIQEILALCPQCVCSGSGVGKSSLVSSVFNIPMEETGVQHHQVGTANIKTEFRSDSNMLFILHDSQGFEPGSDASLGLVTAFISERCATSKKLRDRLHAIW